MADALSPDGVLIETDGERVKLVVGSAARGLLTTSPYRAHGHGEDGLSLVPAQVSGFLSGTLATMALPDLFAHVLAGIRSGRLVVTRGVQRRTVAFRDGQIVFAGSTERYERLGSVLTKLGLVSREDLDAALLQVGPRARLGQVLTRAGLITSTNLYNAMTYVVREIVVNLFEAADGEFMFLEGDPGSDALKLPERTKALVLEGLKRGEEVERLRRRFPAALRVQGGPAPLPVGTDPLAAHVAHGASLGELRGRFEGSDHAFYNWVDEQLRSGTWMQQMPVAQEAPASHAGSRSALELYTDLIAAIARAMRDAGEDLGVLRSFDEQHAPGLEEAFAGVSLSDEGQLDLDRLVANVSKGDAVRDRVRVYAALDAYVAYALFAARNALPPHLAEALADAARQMREEQ